MKERQTQADIKQPPAPLGWLTLHEVSAMLGVAPSTVRRWADAGRIPVQRTSGGHRRFEATAVQALQQGPTVPVREPAGIMALPQQRPTQQAWHAHFASAAVAEQMRELGQRLLGLLIQYLVWQGDNRRFLNDGRDVGAQYGAVAHDAGITMRETLEAFLYFRQMFWRTALKMPAVTEANDLVEVMRIAERIDHFMNEVLLSTMSAYE